jgi:hypothetical protein
MSANVNSRNDEETQAPPTSLVEDLHVPRSPSGLARGIVWADILADIAADEAARLRDAA